MTAPSNGRSGSNINLPLVLFALLAMNPAVTFLLLDRIVIAGALTVAAILMLQAFYRQFGMGLPTVYLVNAVALASVLLHAELIVRVRFADYVMEDLYQIRDGYYFNRPGLKSRLTDKEFAADYLTNDEGFRIGFSQQVDVSFDKIDWLFLGDSYTQGAQVQFEELYTTHLYRRFPNRIAANAGISGWGIIEEFNYFRDVAKRYQPKIVFLQVSNFNDFMKVRPREPGLSDHLMQRSLFVRLLLQDLKYQNPVRLPLGRWAEPFYSDEQSNRRFNVFYKPSAPEKETDLRAYATYLARLTQAVRENGARLVLILLPTKEQIRFTYLEEVVSDFRIDPADLDMKRPNTFMRELTDSLGLELIDVLDEFMTAPGEPYFAYDEHLTPYGHQLLADIVARRLSSGDTLAAPEILSETYSGDRYPSYSRDGRLMVFQSFADGNMELFLSDSALGSPRRLTFNDVHESHPSIGFPGDRLAYTEGDQALGNTKVVLSNLSGGGRQSITAAPDEFGAIPSFSSDGTKLVYAGWSVDRRTGTYATPQIVVCELDSGVKRAITNGAAESWRPVFSPDGRTIVFISKVGEQFDLFLFDLPSQAVKRLTDTPFDEWDPQFAPDGQRLVYAAKAHGSWDLFVLSLPTGERTQITFTRGDEWDPVFSPLGTNITYAGEYGIFRGIFRLPVAQ